MDPVIIFCASFLVYGVVFLAIYTFYKLKWRSEFAIAIALAGLIALALASLAGALYFNPRPFVSEHIEPLIAHGADNGFPSQHTVFAMTLTSVIFFYRKKFALWALLLTLLVGTGRVLANVHSWIDILGGLVVGAIAGYFGVQIARFIARQLKVRR